MRRPSQLFFLVSVFVSVLILAACGKDNSFGGETTAGGEAVSSSATPTSTPEQSGRVWTVAEILDEPEIGGSGGTPLCGGEGGFKRCLCAGDVPSYVQYRPAVEECNGNAAAILSGRLFDTFSIVVRDTQNRDRWPEAGSGFGGCSFALANSNDPPKRCSAFKVQDRFEINGGEAEIHCFGASGYSDIFEDAARMTVKITDDPFSSADEIERYCLNGPDQPLN